MTPQHLPELLGPREAAALLRISYERVRQLVNAGELASIATPLGHLVRGSSVRARLESQTLRSRHAHG